MIAFGTFVAVTCMVYGLLFKTDELDESIVGRLGNLRSMRPNRAALPDLEAPFAQRVLAPLFTSLIGRITGMLPSTMVIRLEGALQRAGIQMSVGRFIVLVGISAGVVPLLGLLFMASNGASPKNLLFTYGVLLALGVYIPRMMVLSRIKKRQKLIWKALPDAFDLITASVEAGLGIDAAFARVVDKVKGPFALELGKTLREVQMGRIRREALTDLADRCGVDELRSLLNAIIQAESMGISIGAVIRVQTGVLRTKRRQRAEEQAFKAPIKMVFPLVLCIFPAIMIVIGGPAVIQFMENT